MTTVTTTVPIEKSSAGTMGCARVTWVDTNTAAATTAITAASTTRALATPTSPAAMAPKINAAIAAIAVSWPTQSKGT